MLHTTHLKPRFLYTTCIYLIIDIKMVQYDIFQIMLGESLNKGTILQAY